MKKKNKIIFIKDKVYWIHTTIIIGEYLFYSKWIKKYYNFDIGKQENFGGGNQYLESEAGQAVNIVWMPEFNYKPFDISTLSHELLHATLRVMDKVGVKHDCDNSEPITYYYEFLMREALEQLNVKKK